MTYELAQIAETLKKARLDKGLSQSTLSATAGVPQSHISKIEGGHVDIRISSLIQIARALDLEIQMIPKKAAPAITSMLNIWPQEELKRQQKIIDKFISSHSTPKSAYRIEDHEDE